MAWTALDGIAAIIDVLLGLFCWAFPFALAPAFRRMFQDFGGSLPLLTELGLTLWFPAILGALPLALVGLALIPTWTMSRRRLLLVAAFPLGVGAISVCLAAMYAPIWSLAGSIK